MSNEADSGHRSADSRSIAGLQLGIRELFRIFMPGAYSLVLIGLMPDAGLPDVATSSNSRLTAAALTLGLVAYALRPHECCWPYADTFWRGITDLNRAIHRVAHGRKKDHTAMYKYFLSTAGGGISDRIHYFSSFYYMLVAISFFSGIAAAAEATVPTIELAWALGDRTSATAAAVLLFGAATVQLSFLTVQLQGKVKAGSLFRFLPLLLLLLAGGVAGVAVTVRSGTAYLSPTRVAWVAVTLLASFVFLTFAAKQWRSVIGEQIIHVRHSGDRLAELAKIE